MDRPLLERLRGVPDRLATSARGAPPTAAPGEWSPPDIVRHLIVVERDVWHVRIAQLATEDHPIWAWAEPDRWLDEPGASLESLLDTYRAARQRTVAMLSALDEAGWAGTGTHETFGVLDIASLMSRAADHDDEHLRSLAV